MNQLTRRIGDAGARRPRITIAAWVLFAALVIALAGTFGGSFADQFVAPGSDSDEAMELLQERFPDAAGGTAMAVFAAPEGQRLDEHRAPSTPRSAGSPTWRM